MAARSVLAGHEETDPTAPGRGPVPEHHAEAVRRPRFGAEAVGHPQIAQGAPDDRREGVVADLADHRDGTEVARRVPGQVDRRSGDDGIQAGIAEMVLGEFGEPAVPQLRTELDPDVPDHDEPEAGPWSAVQPRPLHG